MPLITEKEIQYHLDHIQDNRVNDILVSHGVCIGLAAIAVLLRFAARRSSKAQFGADDCMITAALVRGSRVFALGFVVYQVS